MNLLRIIILSLVLSQVAQSQGNLVNDQLRYERVRAAKTDYDESLKELFASHNMSFPPKDIYLRAFKFDKIIELWAPDRGEYTLIKTYDICSLSGKLGPKRMQGDMQIPEGFYNLTTFNAASNYYLSMRVNYPNESDRILGVEGNLGGDIYLHGDCVTIGCLPIQDEPVKELYWLALQTKQYGGAIPIHIYPFYMDNCSMEFFERLPIFTKANWDFWHQMVPAFDYFESHRIVPPMTVLPDGTYTLNNDLNLVNN